MSLAEVTKPPTRAEAIAFDKVRNLLGDPAAPAPDAPEQDVTICDGCGGKFDPAALKTVRHPGHEVDELICPECAKAFPWRPGEVVPAVDADGKLGPATKAALRKLAGLIQLPRAARLRGAIRDLLQELALDSKARGNEPADLLRILITEARQLVRLMCQSAAERARILAQTGEHESPHFDQSLFTEESAASLRNVEPYLTLALHTLPDK